MKVKDTISVDLIYSTVRGRMKEFLSTTDYFYTNDSEAARIIARDFPNWQYTGVAPFEEVMVWCEEHFGRDWLWTFETVYFKNERDKAVFLLKWS